MTGAFTQPIETDIELKQPFETLAIIGVDKERLAALAPDLTDEQMQALLATCIPLRKISEMGIVDSIETVE